MSDFTDSLWDESDDFSGDQLEKMDIMASQALGITAPNSSSRVYPTSFSASEGYHSAYSNESLTFIGKPRTIQSNAPQFKSAATTRKPSVPFWTNVQHPSSKTPATTTLQSSSNYSESLVQELEKSNREVQDYKEQMKKIKEDQYSKDGQINMLRQSLTQKESELFRVKQEKLDTIRQKESELSLRHKELESEISKMKTDILFKDREIVELQTTNKNLEKQVQVNNNHITLRSPKSSVRDSQSPRHSVSPRTGSSPRKFSDVTNFPTAQSFLGDNGKSKSVKNKEVQCDATVSCHSKPKRRRHHLELNTSSGDIPGPCIVSKMLPNGDAVSHSGLIGLFNQRFTPEPGTMSRSTSHEKELEHRLSAYEAIHVLLNDEDSSNSQTSRRLNSFDCQSVETCKILPCINDYLLNYVDSVECKKKVLLRTQSSTGSFHGSSLDTLSEYSVQDKASTNDNTLENAVDSARNALHVLLQLVIHCQPIRDSLLSVDGPMNKQDTTDNTDRVSIFSTLQKLLLTRSDEGTVSKTVLSEECMMVLIALVRKSGNDSLQRFDALLLDGTILDCLMLSDEPKFLSSTLNLLISLVGSYSVVSTLCAPTDNCVLSVLYSLCIKPIHYSADISTLISYKIVCLLMSIVQFHRYGALMLLQTDCHCSAEVAKAIVGLIYREIGNDNELSSLVLRHGLILLHWFSEWDQNFVKHSTADDHKYISVISKLEMIYKNLHDIPHHERELLQDLWESAEVDDNSQEEDSVNPVAMEIG